VFDIIVAAKVIPFKYDHLKVGIGNLVMSRY